MNLSTDHEQLSKQVTDQQKRDKEFKFCLRPSQYVYMHGSVELQLEAPRGHLNVSLSQYTSTAGELTEWPMSAYSLIELDLIEQFVSCTTDQVSKTS